ARAPHEGLEAWAGDLPEPERRHVGRAQRQHPRGEGELAVARADEPELLEGQQQAAGGGPREPGGLRDVAERHLGPLAAEAGDDVQAPRPCLDEVGSLATSGHDATPWVGSGCGSGALAGPGLAEDRTPRARG